MVAMLTLLSRLFPGSRPRTVFKQARDGDEPLLVLDDGDHRSLHFGTGPVQSRMAFSDPSTLVLAYTQAMMAALLFIPPPRHAVLIGLGGGSLVRFLRHHQPACRLTVVEPDRDVQQAARQWFRLDDDPAVEIETCGGEAFLCRPGDGATDLLLVDAFAAHAPASELEQPEVFAGCREQLSPRGVAVFNLWSSPAEMLQRPLQLIGSAFDNRLLRLPVSGKGNLIILAFPHAVPNLQDRRLILHARHLRSRLGLDMPDFLNRLRQVND